MCICRYSLALLKLADLTTILRVTHSQINYKNGTIVVSLINLVGKQLASVNN